MTGMGHSLCVSFCMLLYIILSSGYFPTHFTFPHTFILLNHFFNIEPIGWICLNSSCPRLSHSSSLSINVWAWCRVWFGLGCLWSWVCPSLSYEYQNYTREIQGGAFCIFIQDMPSNHAPISVSQLIPAPKSLRSYGTVPGLSFSRLEDPGLLDAISFDKG